MIKELIVKQNHNSTSIEKIVHEASHFNGKILFICDTKKVNAKSIMGVLTLSLRKGDIIKVEINGDEENKIFKKIEKLL